jgi:hypothetical protein
MKNIITFICIINFFACRAQYPTVSLYNPSIDHDENGYYYKDFNNDLNVFEGTWVFTNGNTSLTLILQKKIMGHVDIPTFNTCYYTDAVIGEYSYIENGVEKINTLFNLNNNFSSPDKYNIVMDYISKYGDPSCNNCQPNNIRLSGTYSEPNCDRWMSPHFYLRYFVENGIEKIDLHFSAGERIMSDMYGNPPPCDEYALPFGEYILIKQD